MVFVGNRVNNALFDEIVIPVTAGNTSSTEFVLNYRPRNKSVWVMLNGVVLNPAEDYTIDYNTKKVILTGCVARTVEDVLYFKYMY